MKDSCRRSIDGFTVPSTFRLRPGLGMAHWQGFSPSFREPERGCPQPQQLRMFDGAREFQTVVKFVRAAAEDSRAPLATGSTPPDKSTQKYFNH